VPHGTASANRGAEDRQLPGRKSVRTALLLSLLMPGTGERYAGSRRYAYGFWAAEGAVWSYALFNELQGAIIRRDYISYAAQHAGSNPDQRSDDYYRDIYEWPNSDWFNEDQWRRAREQYPDDLDAQARYAGGKLYPAADAWQWDDTAEWRRYRGLRVRSQNALHRVSYAIGAALANRLLSGVNAVRVARAHNRGLARAQGGLEWNLRCLALSRRSMSLSLAASF
jgi:hypothetical protein